jgi:hypothetical protein
VSAHNLGAFDVARTSFMILLCEPWPEYDIDLYRQKTRNDEECLQMMPLDIDCNIDPLNATF